MLPHPAPLFGPAIRRIPRGRRQIALTFDDGPSPATPAVLDLLETFGVRATFFQCGANAERLPGISRQVWDRGHGIGNHTFFHPRLLLCSPARIGEEIASTQRAIELAAGVTPAFFRPPYGMPGFGQRAALAAHGLTSVLWTVMGYDWVWEADEIADHVLSYVSDGGIICLHDGDRVSPAVDRSNTLTALGRVVPALQKRGFSFVTMEDL